MWPSFGCFSTVILVNFSCANSSFSANFRNFLCMVLSYPYQKSFKKKSVLKIFIILFEQDCPEAVVHGWVYKMNLSCSDFEDMPLGSW